MNNTSPSLLPSFLLTKEQFAFMEADWLWKAKELETRLKSDFPPMPIFPSPLPNVEPTEVAVHPNPNP